MDGFPTTANSDKVNAPLLAIIISERTGKDIKKVLVDMDRDFWMTSEEAMEYGAIDEILSTKRH